MAFNAAAATRNTNELPDTCALLACSVPMSMTRAHIRRTLHIDCCSHMPRARVCPPGSRPSNVTQQQEDTYAVDDDDDEFGRKAHLRKLAISEDGGDK